MSYEKCLRCGRKLKDAIARQRGYGNTCYRKQMGVVVRSKKNKSKRKGLTYKKLFEVEEDIT